MTTPVLSGFAFAAPVKGDPTLDISIAIRANCNTRSEVHLCPGGNDMITHVAGQSFPAGECCGITKILHIPIPVGETYHIGTSAKSISGYYRYELANIQGSPPFGTGGCTGTNSCEAKMEASGAKVIVNFHWAAR
ncbi:MAG TPA: hypothetical protein VEH06_17065 [Candidatus Bathyarchaeia archaeon]|nr:hypothetical protein [Candidatus Bathyarchaeia archaeon]